MSRDGVVFFHLFTTSSIASRCRRNIYQLELHRTEISGNMQLANGRYELQPCDEGIDHLFRQEGHSTRHCKWQRAKSLNALIHASGALHHISNVSGAHLVAKIMKMVGRRLQLVLKRVDQPFIIETSLRDGHPLMKRRIRRDDKCFCQIILSCLTPKGAL